MFSFCPLSGTILFLVAHTIPLFLALWADLTSSTDRASQTFLSTSSLYCFCLHYYLGFFSCPFTTLSPPSKRQQSVSVIPLLYNILQFFFFSLKVHHLHWGFTEASPKPVLPLSTVCAVFHCVVVTPATSVPSAYWAFSSMGPLHMLCVLKGDILQPSARLLAAGALRLVLKVTSEASPGTQKQLLFSVIPSHNFLLQCYQKHVSVFACLFAVSNILLFYSLPWKSLEDRGCVWLIGQCISSAFSCVWLILGSE